jgi:DUF1680 family protein
MTALLTLVLATQATQLPPIVNLQSVPFTEVKIQDKFWAPKQRTNREVSIPHTFEMCEKTPRIANFELAAKSTGPGHKGLVFDDSDVYKSLEAASYALASQHDPKLDAKVDEWIGKIGAAQRPDGYLDTAYILGRLDKRFSNLADDHELYCAGHLFEAAVAHYQATGKKSLLNIATKLADLLCNTFGIGDGRRMGYPGHPECELALIKLWRATGQQRYFDLAKFFIANRGSRFFADERHVQKDKFDGTYWLDDIPITEHKEIKGHAVRAAYLLSGTADLDAVTKDEKLHQMLSRVWRNTVYKRVFVTGGIGPSGSNEGFTVDYDLPNASAYQETCASVAMILWNHRMGLLEGNAKYWDWVERALYNGFLSGVSLKGDTFFYVNPLASAGNHHRSDWFACACCPPNVTRTLASLGQYLYAKTDDALYVNLYTAGEVNTKVGSETADFKIETDFPWNGKIVITPVKATSKSLDLKLRIPSWCPSFGASVNGQSQRPQTQNGYLTVSRKWAVGDRVELNLAMPVMQVEAHPEVKDDAGRLSIQRGPVIYCLEQIDQSAPLDNTFIPAGTEFRVKQEPSLLGGVATLEGSGKVFDSRNWKNALYLPQAFQSTPIKAVPYYAWDNRKACAMEVWMPTSPPSVPSLGLEQGAKVSLSYTSNLCRPNAIRDGKPIQASNKHPGDLTHFWPHKGGTEWVQYTWSEPQWVSGSKIYWFDDTGFGECRIPGSWEIQYLDAGIWKPVKANGYPLALDQWCETKFEPVKATALRLSIKMQNSWSVGIHEWHIVEPEE